MRGIEIRVPQQLRVFRDRGREGEADKAAVSNFCTSYSGNNYGAMGPGSSVMQPHPGLVLTTAEESFYGRPPPVRAQTMVNVASRLGLANDDTANEAVCTTTTSVDQSCMGIVLTSVDESFYGTQHG